MALGLLCVGLLLMGALKIQAQDSLPTFTPKSPLMKFPLMPDFQYEQFQGKWYTIAWAQNTAKNESRSQMALQTTIYKLNDDHSYNVTSEWLSDQKCVKKLQVISPADQPGVFNLENITHYDEFENFTMRVLETDYNQFAVLDLEMTAPNKVYFEYILYGRTKKLSAEVKEHFYNISKSLGFPEEYIVFTDPSMECTDN